MQIARLLARGWKKRKSAWPLLTVLLASAGSVRGQGDLSLPVAAPAQSSVCNAEEPAAGEPLTLRWRACWYGSKLTSPWGLLRGALSSGIGQWENNPHVRRQEPGDYAQRFAVYYAKRAARNAGELMAGYLNHEDPRPHLSGETATGKRIRSALLSVLVVRSDTGRRPAFMPIAGSLGSTFVGTAMYSEHSELGYGFRSAGVSYSVYFVKALCREFRPEMSLLAGRVLHRKVN